MVADCGGKARGLIVRKCADDSTNAGGTSATGRGCVKIRRPPARAKVDLSRRSRIDVSEVRKGSNTPKTRASREFSHSLGQRRTSHFCHTGEIAKGLFGTSGRSLVIVVLTHRAKLPRGRSVSWRVKVRLQELGAVKLLDATHTTSAARQHSKRGRAGWSVSRQRLPRDQWRAGCGR